MRLLCGKVFISSRYLALVPVVLLTFCRKFSRVFHFKKPTILFVIPEHSTFGIRHPTTHFFGNVLEINHCLLQSFKFSFRMVNVRKFPFLNCWLFPVTMLRRFIAIPIDLQDNIVQKFDLFGGDILGSDSNLIIADNVYKLYPILDNFG